MTFLIVLMTYMWEVWMLGNIVSPKHEHVNTEQIKPNRPMTGMVKHKEKVDTGTESGTATGQEWNEAKVQWVYIYIYIKLYKSVALKGRMGWLWG